MVARSGVVAAIGIPSRFAVLSAIAADVATRPSIREDGDTEQCLIGETLSGIPLVGCDSVRFLEKP